MNVIYEQTEIKKGLLYFWSCKICRNLGWDKEHGCPENNGDCETFLYKRLKKHYDDTANETRTDHE